VKLCYHTGGLDYLPFADVVAELATAGYDGVGPATGPGCHLDPSSIGSARRVREIAERHGLDIPLLNPWGVPGLASHVQRGDGISFYKQCIDCAATMGVPFVKFLSGATGSDSEGWRILIPALRELCAYAEQMGVALVMHHHEDQILDTPEKLLLMEMWVESPALRCLVDICNMHLLNWDIPYAIRLLGERIVHVRFKGIIGRYPHSHFVVPGSPGDETDLAPALAALTETGYDRFIDPVTFPWMPRDHATAMYDNVARRLAECGVRAYEGVTETKPVKAKSGKKAGKGTR
jgi:sugar phosphate isomerase/epimerase